MNIKKPTVSIGVSVYNEQNNITQFIKSLLAQKEDGYILKSINIYSDGCTDNTVKIINSFNSKKIKLFIHKRRMGKSYRLNQIYQDCKTDYLVQSDADAIFANPYVVKNIVNAFINDKKIGMCGGHSVPIKGKTFIEKAVNITHKAYMPLKKTLRGGNNIFSIDGKILAFRRTLIKSVKVPKKSSANDTFMYFSCLQRNMKYKYVPKSIVNYRSPQTLNDHLRQNIRFVSAKKIMFKYFNKSLVEKEFYIPPGLLRKLMLRQFLTHPIHALTIFVINSYCRYKSSVLGYNSNGKWEIAYSTKKI